MSRMERVLILSAGVGSGHNSAAAAVSAACAQRADIEEVRVVDVLQESTALYRELLGKGYFVLADSVPWLVDWGYDVLDQPYRRRGPIDPWTRANALPTISEIKAFRPTAIVCTHFLPAQLIASLLLRGTIDAKTAVVTTDYDFQGLWLQSAFHTLFVARQEGRAQLTALGLPPDRVTASGIPIIPSPEDSPARDPQQPPDPADLRRRQGRRLRGRGRAPDDAYAHPRQGRRGHRAQRRAASPHRGARRSGGRSVPCARLHLGDAAAPAGGRPVRRQARRSLRFGVHGRGPPDGSRQPDPGAGGAQRRLPDGAGRGDPVQHALHDRVEDRPGARRARPPRAHDGGGPAHRAAPCRGRRPEWASRRAIPTARRHARRPEVDPGRERAALDRQRPHRAEVARPPDGQERPIAPSRCSGQEELDRSAEALSRTGDGRPGAAAPTSALVPVRWEARRLLQLCAARTTGTLEVHVAPLVSRTRSVSRLRRARAAPS